MKWYGIQLGLWFRFLVYGIWRGVQENLILFPLVANQSYRHSLSISSRCAAPICWISLTLSMPFPNALTNYYLQIGLFFLLHHSQSNISVFCLDFTVCAAPTRRTKEKSLERIIHSIINLHISQSDCTTYLLFLFMFLSFMASHWIMRLFSLAYSLRWSLTRSKERKIYHKILWNNIRFIFCTVNQLDDVVILFFG